MPFDNRSLDNPSPTIGHSTLAHQTISHLTKPGFVIDNADNIDFNKIYWGSTSGGPQQRSTKGGIDFLDTFFDYQSKITDSAEIRPEKPSNERMKMVLGDIKSNNANAHQGN